MKSRTKLTISLSILVISFIFLGISTYYLILSPENNGGGEMEEMILVV